MIINFHNKSEILIKPKAPLDIRPFKYNYMYPVGNANITWLNNDAFGFYKIWSIIDNFTILIEQT